MNCPEDLFEHLSNYDGVISCRLHPNIISFSMGIPSVGLIWNTKVANFYHAVGYDNRAVTMGSNTTTEEIIEKLDNAMSEGVTKDEDYLISVYANLYEGIGSLITNVSEPQVANMYSYQDVVNKLPRYSGTSDKERKTKLERKFRRAYDNFYAAKKKAAVSKEPKEFINRINDEHRKNVKLQIDINNKKKEIGKLQNELSKMKIKLEKNKTTKQAVKNIIKNFIGRS